MPEPTGLKRFLPPIGSPAYHVMLSVVAITILGPLGGISAAFMNFSIGFFVGGQVLAGILGSVVTLPYGPEGKHGANYMQTMAASVAGMCAMAVLIQAMVWLGLPPVPDWKMILFLTCIGMFGVGVGMLYTPVLVDRMQLTYPSGFAVANILRALTDPALLRRSIAKLGGGMLGGYGVGFASFKVAAIGAYGVSASTVGAGFIVGARIAIPALVVALIGLAAKPHLIEIGWLGANDPYRKIGFIISLGTILGAAGLDIVLILIEAAKRFRQQTPVAADPDWKRVNMVRLLLWIAGWGAGIVILGSQLLQQPVFFLVVALALVFVFVLVNGISLGISDWNPISSAFVMSVFIMAALGLKDPGVGLMCSAILLISCSVGGDMQQDRSTGWRLGTNRVNQFRYQVIGIACGAVLTVVLAKVFMSAYPILQADQFSNPHLEGAQQWQSAMTYKFVGAIKGITLEQPHVLKALWLGITVGLVTMVIRKLIKRTAAYQAFVARSGRGRATDFVVDAVLLPSPYASSFGGFVEIPTVLWWAGGGIFGSLYTEWAEKRKAAAAAQADALPSDMSTMSLVGGGLIAGDSLAALSVGIYGLLRTVL
ncbi:OPT oligopeptide transporter protein [Lacunisphaera limnophila]|uniref:OPT oligopeptide transporter protein n=1 Tax=Lacunisphaera limnophila TaxID=1838286 RepID=A0A1D8AWZ0_9BACT|nr:OPT/YSL family transporter [Lacunisphaera limnophila]AOS45404.1 OPT oligopeptide transporter protein [Lacunisphaera limnophila]